MELTYDRIQYYKLSRKDKEEIIEKLKKFLAKDKEYACNSSNKHTKRRHNTERTKTVHDKTPKPTKHTVNLLYQKNCCLGKVL
jgi:hypothetical protein